MVSRKEIYGGKDDLDPDEPRGQVRITAREYLTAQEHGFLPRRPTEAIIGCGFFEYMSALQRTGAIKPWRGIREENVTLEAWAEEERHLYGVFVTELHRESGIVLNEEMVTNGWEYYQNM